MPNPDTFALAASAHAEGLDCVLVGGNAVNLYAYFRTTFDIDLLVREVDLERWLSFFEGRDYRIVRRTNNFVRLSLADPAAALPVDLMLADKHTFSAIKQESRRCEIREGITLSIPSALHLIAMKLHALRNPRRAETGVDLQDVKHLIKATNIDTASKQFTDIAERYATEEIRNKIRRDFDEESRA